MSLSKSDIAAANDLLIEKVNVPEWSGDVFLRCMTGAERDKFEQENSKLIQSGTVKENFRSIFVAIVMCEENGNAVFDNIDDGVSVLSKKSSKVISRLFDVAFKLSGFEGEEVEEFEKN